jgi:hypothetical protein
MRVNYIKNNTDGFQTMKPHERKLITRYAYKFCVNAESVTMHLPSNGDVVKLNSAK